MTEAEPVGGYGSFVEAGLRESAGMRGGERLVETEGFALLRGVEEERLEGLD